MQLKTKFTTLYISTDIQPALEKVLDKFRGAQCFVLVDENTKEHCLPSIVHHLESVHYMVIEIPSGEKNKSLNTVTNVWQTLTEKGADRNSLFINLGGGIVGDLGGFVASTFKRGMPFINIPTTLLSQVDASVGGKTGINFSGLKNEIGVFNHPQHVLIDSTFNRTLSRKHILSGWAEMLKHALISSEEDWQNLISHDIRKTGFKELNQLIARSVHIKNHFVEEDPNEKGIRKALNFGHTFGHAFESLFMNTSDQLLHGEAVAHGMVCELYLSTRICNFPEEKMLLVVRYLLQTYTKPAISESVFEKLYELITHDKKNEGSQINFTLLADFGKLKINTHCTKEAIFETLNWYKSL